MKNNLLIFTLISSFTNSLLQSMDIVSTIPAKSPKLLFLDSTLEKINSKKDFNPKGYFADKQKIANTIYAITLLRECLFNVKKDYDICKAAEWAAFHNNKYINGHFIVCNNEDTKIIDKIKTDLGFLKEHISCYGDKEYQSVLTTPAERAFFFKSAPSS